MKKNESFYEKRNDFSISARYRSVLNCADGFSDDIIDNYNYGRIVFFFWLPINRRRFQYEFFLQVGFLSQLTFYLSFVNYMAHQRFLFAFGPILM